MSSIPKTTNQYHSRTRQFRLNETSDQDGGIPVVQQYTSSPQLHRHPPRGRPSITHTISSPTLIIFGLMLVAQCMLLRQFMILHDTDEQIISRQNDWQKQAFFMSRGSSKESSSLTPISSLTKTYHPHPSPLLTITSFALEPQYAMEAVSEYWWTREQVQERLRLLQSHDASSFFSSSWTSDATTSNPQLIYFVTPTHYHKGQWIDFVRLSQTLMHFGHQIYWIVIEDSTKCTRRIRSWLDASQLMYAHLQEESPSKSKNPQNHRGVNQRNRALDHIMHEIGMDGVVYFGDSDNAYSVLLFPELLKTQRVSVFGVGFSGKRIYERCHVNPRTGKVDQIFGWGHWKRKYPMDMAGFAFHTSILQEKHPRFEHSWTKGFLESNFLDLLIEDLGELEPLCNNCTSIYTWHVKTDSVYTDAPYGNDTQYSVLKDLV